MFEINQKWTPNTLRLRSEQDAIDSAFRSGDLSGLADLGAETIERAEQSFRRAARHQRELCDDAAVLADQPDVTGVVEWISATQGLIERQERFADALAELTAPAPQGTSIPLGKSAVKSAS